MHKQLPQRQAFHKLLAANSTIMKMYLHDESDGGPESIQDRRCLQCFCQLSYLSWRLVCILPHHDTLAFFLFGSQGQHLSIKSCQCPAAALNETLRFRGAS